MNDIDKDNIAARRMIYSADGTLLQKLEGKTTTNTTIAQAMNGTGGFTQESASMHFTSGGNYLGEIGESKKKADGSKGDFINTLKASQFKLPELSAGTPTFRYQVRQGDTLKALALSFYGNADYWYLIANANGVASDPTMPLVAGLSIEIPPRGNVENNANSFKPMQVEHIIGNTLPSLPYLPPPPKCNALAMVVMIAITVVATIATAGAAAAAMGGVVGGATGMAAGTAVLGGTAIAGTGAVVSAIGGAAAGALAAAAGGFMGSVAGQLAGKAMGVVEHFSLRNAVASGLTAGATAGMGNFLGAGQEIKAGANAAETASKLGRFATASVDATKTTMSSLSVYGKMAMAASSVGFNVAANKLAGNNNVSFSWRNVVTSAATAWSMDYLGISDTQSSWGKATNELGFTADVLNGFAGAAVGYGVGKALYNKGGWNFRDVATDVFGNALGNAVVKRVTDYQEERFRETEKLSQNMAEIDARNASGLAVDGLLDTFGKIDQEIADNIHDDFYGELFVATQLNDQLAGIASEKNANAIFKYNAMSAQTHKDIAAIEQRSRESAQKRAEQSEILRVRQQEKLIDFRMDNPVYRAPVAIFDYEAALEYHQAIRQAAQHNAEKLDKFLHNPAVVVTIGAVQTIEGAIVFGAGALTALTGVGVGLMAIGTDQMQAGLRTVYNRDYADSLLNKGLKTAGLSPTQAAVTEAVLTFGTASFASTVKSVAKTERKVFSGNNGSSHADGEFELSHVNSTEKLTGGEV